MKSPDTEEYIQHDSFIHSMKIRKANLDNRGHKIIAYKRVEINWKGT